MKTSWRRLLNVFRLRLQNVFKMSSRRINQDEYTSLSHTSSEDLFRTSWPRRIYVPWLYVLKTFYKNVFKTSWRHLKHVLKTSWRCFAKIDAFETYHQVKLLLLTRFQDFFKTYSSRFWDVLKDGYLQKDVPRSHFMVRMQNFQESTH